MGDKRQIFPIAGLVATIAVSGYMAVQLEGQSAVEVAGDYTKAAVAEVRNAQGLVVLHGEFAPDDDGDADETERKAILKPLGVAGTSEGEAEVEFVGAAPTVQEVEFSVRGLSPGTTLSFEIDGKIVAMAVTDRRGRAEVELDVKMPGR